MAALTPTETGDTLPHSSPAASKAQPDTAPRAWQQPCLGTMDQAQGRGCSVVSSRALLASKSIQAELEPQQEKRDIQSEAGVGTRPGLGGQQLWDTGPVQMSLLSPYTPGQSLRYVCYTNK